MHNTINGPANNSTISGGVSNTASAQYSAIGGGKWNNTSGRFSTIPGGKGLTASSFVETVIGVYNTLVTPINANGFDPADQLFVVGNGTSSGARSNAMVILKNGNTDINGNLVANSLGVDGVFTLPTTDGTAGQVLQTDGAGAVTWQTASGGGGGAFTTASNLTSNSGGDLANDDFLFGSAQLADAGNAAEDNRMFFDKSNGAFRVGTAQGNQWDSRGTNSFAAGINNIAAGNNSTVSGGFGNNASSFNSTIGGGFGNVASSYNSTVAGGYNNTASLNYATVGGGYGNTASNSSATISGVSRNEASAYSATVSGGTDNVASGKNSSVAGGKNINAQALGEFATGLYSANAASANATSFVATDRLFTLGNGTSSVARSNAFTILKNGNATLAGTLTQNSDRRLKREIAPLGNTLAKVNEMEGVTYKWNNLTPRDTTEANIGLIAQEVEALFPELVKTGDNGYKSVNYIQLVPVLIEAIKELSKENDALETANATMEIRQQGDDQKFVALEAKLDYLMQMMTVEASAGAVGND